MPAEQRVSRVVLALLAGLVVGIAVGATGSTWALTAVHALAPLGTVWINAVRMTVVPLVVALLFTSIAGAADARLVRRETFVAFSAFLGMLLLAAGLSLALAPGLIQDMRLAPDVSAALRSSATATATATRSQFDQLPGLGDWLRGLIPSNAVRAAADGAMLPLILFTALFAFGARQIAADRRAVLTTFFRGVADAMLVVVGWTIVVAPIGVFALIVGPAAEQGPRIAGAIGYYVVAITVLLFLFTLLLYPIAHFSGIHVARFSREALPAQAVAMASSSSIASLPALLRSASELGIPERTSGFVIPLAVGTFKAATPISWTIGTLFIARLYGVPLGSGAVFWVALTAVGASFSIPGVPQGSLLLLSAVLATVGVPAEGVALLIAADTIPDLVGTVTNVTGDLVASIVVARATRSTSAHETMMETQPDFPWESEESILAASAEEQ